MALAAMGLASSVIYSLLPEGSTAKYVRFISAIILIICLMSPIKSVDFDNIKFNFSSIFTTGTPIDIDIIDKQVKELYENRLDELLSRSLLENCNTAPAMLDYEFSGYGSNISLDMVVVSLNKTDAAKAGACEFYIKKTLGLNVLIKILE